MAGTPPKIFDASGAVIGTPQTSDSTNNDPINAAKIAASKISASETAGTSNELVLDPTASDGKLFIQSKTKVDETVVGPGRGVLPTASSTAEKGDKGDRGDKGPKGDKGDKGDPGAPGPEAEVDYDFIRDMIQEMLDDMLNLKFLQFVEPTPTQVFGTKTINLPVELVDRLSGTSVLVTPLYSLSTQGIGTISTTGLFTGEDVSVDRSVTVTADFMDERGRTYTTLTPILVKALRVSALAVGGPTSIDSEATGTFTATVTYTDSSTKVVSVDPATTWSIQSGTIGTLASNVLTAPLVGANVNGVVKASYVEKNVTVEGTRAVTIVAPLPTAFYGSSSIPTGTYSEIDWEAFVKTLKVGTTTRAAQFNVTMGTGQYGWYAAPVSFGITSDQQFLDKDSGLLGGGWGGAMWANNGAFTASAPRKVNITNNGNTIQYNLWRTDYSNLGATHWQIN